MLADAVKEKRVVQALLGEPACAAAILGGKWALDELTLDIEPGAIVTVCSFLKQRDQYNRLISVTAVDWFPQEPRFEIVYQLMSTHRTEWLRLKCRVGGAEPAIDSVYNVWKSADWYEREIFDMFGVTFRNHPNLKRILMPDDWRGHPLRKDYPVHGYKYSYQNE